MTHDCLCVLGYHPGPGNLFQLGNVTSQYLGNGLIGCENGAGYIAARASTSPHFVVNDMHCSRISALYYIHALHTKIWRSSKSGLAAMKQGCRCSPLTARAGYTPVMSKSPRKGSLGLAIPLTTVGRSAPAVGRQSVARRIEVYSTPPESGTGASPRSHPSRK